MAAAVGRGDRCDFDREAHLPPLVKKLGLFAIAYGLIAGWVAARLASQFELRPTSRSLRCGIVFLLIIGGQIGMAAEAHRIRQAAERQKLAGDSKRATVLKLLGSTSSSGDSKSNADLEQMRRTLSGDQDMSFAGYLRYRVSELGEWVQWAGIAIWIVEILLGGLAGTWIFRRLDAARPAA